MEDLSDLMSRAEQLEQLGEERVKNLILMSKGDRDAEVRYHETGELILRMLSKDGEPYA